MSNQNQKHGYRINYDVDELNTMGSMDIPVSDKLEALKLFWERMREKFDGAFGEGEIVSDYVDITSIREKTFQVCKACGQPMGNLGLVFDECVNEECELYLNAQDQSLPKGGI